jgi:hypothetical protein
MRPARLKRLRLLRILFRFNEIRFVTRGLP